jgi:hypothetical protein
MMAPTSASATPEDTECAGLALCGVVGLLGWTAINPCSGCVVTARGPISARAGRTGNRNANPVQVVTGDAFELLLCQAAAAQRGISTS